MNASDPSSSHLTRRKFLAAAAATTFVAASGVWLKRSLSRTPSNTATFIHRVANYEGDLRTPILSGLRELGYTASDVRGKKILLKPNLVEPHAGIAHINTNPRLIRAAVEAFLSLGAAQVAVAEGPGHRTDTLLVLDESGLSEVLAEDHIRFIDLNYDSGLVVPNRTKLIRTASLTVPRSLAEFDWLISMPKMKTHHWVGVTLSMKNLFGIMPGVFYGWPKNVFHLCGIENSILDINATVPMEMAIVDGIIGMEGDGPIMGDPKNAGVIVMGRGGPSVDATCARVMGIDPAKIHYLAGAQQLKLGTIDELAIEQRGEAISKVRTDFKLLNKIQAQQGIRLA